MFLDVYSPCWQDLFIDKICAWIIWQTAVIDSGRLLPREASLSWLEARQTCHLGHSWTGKVPRTCQELLPGSLRCPFGIWRDGWGLFLESDHLVQRADSRNWKRGSYHSGRKQMRHNKLDRAKGGRRQLRTLKGHRTCAHFGSQRQQCGVHLQPAGRK